MAQVGFPRIGRRDALRLLGGGVAAWLTAFRSTALAQSRPDRAEILTRQIPASGESLPVVGLGTWQTFDVRSGGPEYAQLAEILREFVAFGGTVVDTSPMYGNAERILGDLALELRVQDQLFFATKVWTRGSEAGVAQMENSLEKLQADAVDLMQVHNLVDAAAHLQTLRAWKEEERVRYIGITHYTASRHDDVARLIETEPVDFVQINYSVAERQAERRLLPLARERRVAVIANRPFASGDVFRRLRGRAVPEWAAEWDCTSWAQLMLKFIIAHPAITCAIPATSKLEHLRDNMQAAFGPLPDESGRERIAAATS